MGASTQFFTPTDLTIMQVVASIEHTLNTKATEIRLHDDGRFGNFCFEYEGEYRTFNVFRQSRDFRAEVDHTCLDLSATGNAVAIMQQLAPLWGGYLIANDCSVEEPVYVPAAPEAGAPPLTNEHKLFELVASQLGHEQADEVIGFLKANKARLSELLPD